MTKTHTSIGIAVVILFSLFAANAHADARSSLRGGISIAPPSSPAPVVPFVPQTPSGISNTTSGEVDSGGNTGGNVTTGDESIDVHVRNEGPTNSNTVVTNVGSQTPPPAPAPTCEPSRMVRCDTDTRNR